MKSQFMTWYQRIVPFVFSAFGWWLAYEFYISPLSNVGEKVSADPIYIFSFVFGASIGFFAFAPLVIRHTIAKGNFNNKVFLSYLFAFGIAGTIGNAALYKSVIKPSNMIECPKSSGYKSNLLRDYVLDKNQCESF